ncbi:MAG: hypothetical protein WA737_02910, partial [Candidatus Acidiferrales bacterium]
PKTKSNPNTMCLPITLGGNHGSGHFYLAQNRTFLLCVDTRARVRTAQNLAHLFGGGLFPNLAAAHSVGWSAGRLQQSFF